jgi:predicted GNAT family acetyltransferase
MKEKIDGELRHIPRSFRGSNQNMVRAAYNMIRRHDLALNPHCSAQESLTRAIEQLKKTHLEFSPLYDKGFFEKDS